MCVSSGWHNEVCVSIAGEAEKRRAIVKTSSGNGRTDIKNNALFPLRGDNEINFLRKKLRGLGYSELR